MKHAPYHTFFQGTTALTLAFSAIANAQPAQNWPQRPVRTVVGFPPGGGIDVVARLLGVPLTERSGQLHGEIVRAMNIPELRDKLIAQGTDPVDSNPKAFGAFMKAESAKWAGVIKQANIRAD